MSKMMMNYYVTESNNAALKQEQGLFFTARFAYAHRMKRRCRHGLLKI